MTFTSLTPTITGTLSNVHFRHVDIDGNAHSTADHDGCTSAIDSLPFSAKTQ